MDTAVRELWDGCRFCLNPRHPGPCAKPKADDGGAKKPRKAKKATSPGGGKGAEPAAQGKPAEGEAALAAAPVAMPDIGGTGRGFDTLPDDEAHALQYFRGEGYRKVTPALYRGKANPEVQGRIDHLDSAMNRSHLDSDVVTYRGTPDLNKLVGTRAARGNLTGVQFTDKAFLSTSADQRMAKHFSVKGTKASGKTPTVFRYTVPKGTKAIQLSGSKHESELLLQRGLTFRIAADHGVKEDGIRYLDLEVVT